MNSSYHIYYICNQLLKTYTIEQVLYLTLNSYLHNILLWHVLPCYDLLVHIHTGMHTRTGMHTLQVCILVQVLMLFKNKQYFFIDKILKF